ncbi:ATP-dependent dethiobiotin synthetase BioD [Fortiea sp. LEGE XX443]|uniref:dethiobiotin synthase n=1 Tax=Fortiea sp. LEGE XX443 TaxID=1828611 RepID=UPI001882177E|nr:dethiobiotin synthase [Fortiea sp. LEGE XX443]MBE9004327.1 ATP-dependent dethiobiotin synthetase BioD [Fortiea sp. LEGE XX443]
MNTLLITGTDTEAGKTVLTSALAAYWQKYYPQRNWGIMKPIQSGIGDREWYQNLFTLKQSPEEITPLYFQAPLAPPIAAARENRQVDLAVVWKTLCEMRSRYELLLIESAGGLGSPITNELTVADIAGQWRLPTILVVPVRLGAISQAVANVALARQSQVNLKGIVLNCIQPRTDAEITDWTPPELIESFTNIPVLGSLPYFDNPADLDKLAQAASNLNLEALNI